MRPAATYAHASGLRRGRGGHAHARARAIGNYGNKETIGSRRVALALRCMTIGGPAQNLCGPPYHSRSLT